MVGKSVDFTSKSFMFSLALYKHFRINNEIDSISAEYKVKALLFLLNVLVQSIYALGQGGVLCTKIRSL